MKKKREEKGRRGRPHLFKGFHKGGVEWFDLFGQQPITD
jgi:hypothetical protein